MKAVLGFVFLAFYVSWLQQYTVLLSASTSMTIYGCPV